jgi:hypothetical protein
MHRCVMTVTIWMIVPCNGVPLFGMWFSGWARRDLVARYGCHLAMAALRGSLGLH